VTWGIAGEPVRLAGALSSHPAEHGQAPSRLGPVAEAQAMDPQLLWMGRSPSGVRLELETDADVIELDAHVTRLRFLDTYPFPAAFDLVIDGDDVRSVVTTETATWHLTDLATGQMTHIAHPPTTIRFEDLGTATKRVELWLPHSAAVELIDLRLSANATVTPLPPRTRWVHYGSSISHCMEALSPTTTWPAIVARRRNLDLVNLGLGGQAQLDQFAARNIRESAPDLVSMKVGINVLNADSLRERTFVPALHGFLDTIRDVLPTTPILVVTPIVCPIAEDHPGPTYGDETGTHVVERPERLRTGALTLTRIRELITEVVARRIAMGDENLSLLGGLELFGVEDLDELPDGLHPSPAGYRRIAERFDARVFGSGGVWAHSPLLAGTR
jgi:lysophospholipase L1-like esterase